MNNIRSIAVAIVDDDQLFLDYVGHNLGSETGIRIMKMSSEAQLVDAVAQSRVDCVILDFDLGGDNGLVIAQRVKAQFSAPPPIIMLTGAGSERMAVKAFRSGFSDYVSKRNLNIGELLTAIRDAVAKWDTDASTRSEIAQMKQQLTIDPVTGLFSAAAMAAKLERLAREKLPFAALLIDIADLSEIRQKLGHVATENVIRRFADRLKQAASGDDIAGKSTDDSFVYLTEKLLNSRQIEMLKAQLTQSLTFAVAVETATVRLVPSIRHDDTLELRASPPGPTVAHRALDEIGPQMGVPAPAAPIDSPERGLNRTSSSFTPTDSGTSRHASVDTRENHRTERRQRVLKRAKIVDGGRNISIDCTVRDTSPSGFRLKLDSYFSPPDRFELMVVGSGIVQPVRLAWQIGDELGVQFTAPGVPV